jgi:hypothetical protein
MQSRNGWPFVAAAAAVIGLCGCGGSGAKSGGGTTDGGSRDGGSAGNDGTDAGGQVLPPYMGRIVLTPAAVLFTDAGQTATLHAQAFDATGAKMDATFTFTSSQPDQVAVDGNGNVTSMVAVGSTQITVTGAGLTSRPLLVLVVQPQPGTVLISDAQVIAGPKQVDPTADPVPGAQFRVTLDGVGALAPGTMLVSREANPVAGTVVSTSPNGTHTDVVYQLPALLDLFSRMDMRAGYDYNLQTAADDDAIGAMGASRVAPFGLVERSSALDIGPFKCKAVVDPAGITITQSLTVTPTLHFDAVFLKDEDGDWTDAVMVVSGTIKTLGKVSAKLAIGAVASLSCKYQWKEFIPPVAGPLSFIVAPRIPIGVKASIKGAATFSTMDIGGKLEETASFNFGFSAGLHGTGDVATFDLPLPKIDPLPLGSSDIIPASVEISAALGAYASLNVSILEIGLADAFVGGKIKYQLMLLGNQVASQLPNNYQLKAPVLDVGPGSGVDKALSFLGGSVSFKTSITTEGPVIGVSPSGTFTADNTKVDVPANKPINFTVSLDPTTTSFLGASNVAGVHIFRADDKVVPAMFNEVQYLSGPGPTYNWTWTPGVTDEGGYVFVAAADDQLIAKINAIATYAPFLLAKPMVPGSGQIPINVGPPGGNWGGTMTLTWSGSGQTTSGGASMESGSETITYVPGDPSIDGMSFSMVATETTFTITYGFTEHTSLGICPATESYQASGSFTHTGADADMDAHGLLLVIPTGPASLSATYMLGVPGFSVNADFNDDTTSDCGTSTHSMGTVNLGATGTQFMGLMKADDTMITGGTSYTGRDGPSGETMNYNATWQLQKM